MAHSPAGSAAQSADFPAAHGIRRRRAAVVGAGLTGSCVALELAARGWQVDLYDRCSRPMARASSQCEGKVHLGYVYGHDRSLRTARRLQTGAARFRPLLQRWLEPGLLEQAQAQPFLYAIPRGSQRPAAELITYAQAVDALLADSGDPELEQHRGWRRWSEAELAAQFDPGLVEAVLETHELAYDPLRIAEGIRQALARSPVRPHWPWQVRRIRRHQESWRVEAAPVGQPEAVRARGYAVVVNASWEQRLRFDAPLGLGESGRTVIHRYKMGLRSTPALASTTDPLSAASLPSVTFWLGPYGDITNYAGRLYLCWYPSGLRAQEQQPVPSTWELELSPVGKQQLIADTLEGLGTLLPAVGWALPRDPACWQTVGGWISAWGSSGIEDPGSELHARHDIGVHSAGGLHSIDTGKWTTAPWLAAEACRRIGDPP